MSPRLPPLTEDQWAPQLDELRDALGPVLNVHRVLAHHPDLLTAWAPLRWHVVADGSLTPRIRELAILRVAHHAGADYEWHHHVERASAAGVAREELERVRLSEYGAWGEAESAVLAAVDELAVGLTVSDPTWASLTRLFTLRQILDLVVTVGVYTTLAMLINTAEIEMEEE